MFFVNSLIGLSFLVLLHFSAIYRSWIYKQAANTFSFSLLLHFVDGFLCNSELLSLV